LARLITGASIEKPSLGPWTDIPLLKAIKFELLISGEHRQNSPEALKLPDQNHPCLPESFDGFSNYCDIDIMNQPEAFARCYVFTVWLSCWLTVIFTQLFG
jgi:hypothetical protein